MAVPLASCSQISLSQPNCPDLAGGGPCSDISLGISSKTLSAVSCQSSSVKCLNGLSATSYCTAAGSLAGSSDFTKCQSRFNTVYDPASWCGSCNGQQIKGFTNGCCVAESYGITCRVGWRGVVLQDQVSISGLTGTAVFSGVVQMLGRPFSSNGAPQVPKFSR